MLAMSGECDIAVDGVEAVETFELAVAEEKHYDLICLDIMMSKRNGPEVLKVIRRIERERGIPFQDEVKIIMALALDSPKNVIEAYYQGAAPAIWLNRSKS